MSIELKNVTKKFGEVAAVNNVTFSVTIRDVENPVITCPAPIVASAARGTGLSNYTITYHDGALPVNPAALASRLGPRHCGQS